MQLALPAPIAKEERIKRTSEWIAMLITAIFTAIAVTAMSLAVYQYRHRTWEVALLAHACAVITAAFAAFNVLWTSVGFYGDMNTTGAIIILTALVAFIVSLAPTALVMRPSTVTD